MKADSKENPAKWHGIWIIGIVSAGILLLGLGTAATVKGRNQSAAIINGEKLSLKEYELIESSNRSEVISYFQNNYGIEYTEEFWENEYGGESPADYLKKITREQCVEVKVMQHLAKEQGLIEDISYDSIQENMRQENESREQKLSEGKIVYGAMQYTPDTFYRYVNSNLSIELKKQLEQEELKYTEEEIYQYYLEHQSDFQEVREVKYKCCFSDGEEVTGILNQENARTMFQQNEPLYHCLQTIQPGTDSEIIGTDGEKVYVYCFSREDGIAEYEQVRAEAEVRFAQEQYEKYIKQKSKEAEVTWEKE